MNFSYIVVWLAVDRNRILDFAVTERWDLQAYRCCAIKIKQKFKINILRTDAKILHLISEI